MMQSREGSSKPSVSTAQLATTRVAPVWSRWRMARRVARGVVASSASAAIPAVEEGVSKLLIWYPLLRTSATSFVGGDHDYPSAALSILSRNRYRETWQTSSRFPLHI